MDNLNNYYPPEGGTGISAPPAENMLYNDEREGAGILSEIQLLDNAFVTDQNEHSDVNQTPEIDFITGDGLPNTVKFLDENGNVATMGHDDFPLSAPQLNTIFDVFEASQPLFLRDEELQQISDQIQELAQELFTAMLDEGRSSRQHIYTMADNKLKEKTAHFSAKAFKKRAALTRQTQEKLLEELKNNLPELAEALKLDIGIYAYRQYFFQQKYKAFYDFPPDERAIEKAIAVKRILEQCSFTDLRQELLNNPLVNYCGIQIYWSYIKENDSALFEELKQYRDTVLKIASGLSDVQEENRAAWEKILVMTRSELPIMHTETSKNSPIYERVSPTDKFTNKVFDNSITSNKSVGMKTGPGVKTSVIIQTPSNMAPLDYFDEAVNAVCYSFYDAGNHTPTFTSIARALGGKESNHNPSKQLIANIIQSCFKQIGTIVSIDATQEASLYKGFVKKAIFQGPIFNARRVFIECDNGEKADAIQFFAPPINAEYANVKNHIHRSPLKLFNAGLSSTPENIMLQQLLYRKVLVIIRAKPGKTNIKNYIDYDAAAVNLMEQLEHRAEFDSKDGNKTTSKNAVNIRSVKKKRIKEKISKILKAWQGQLYKELIEVKANDSKKTVIRARLVKLPGHCSEIE